MSRTVVKWMRRQVAVWTAVLTTLVLLIGAPEARGESDEWVVDLERARTRWPGPPEIHSVEDLFRLEVLADDGSYFVDSHLFGPVRVLPWDDGDAATDATGAVVGRGDQVLATVFARGELGLALRHRRVGHRRLDLTENGSRASGPLEQEIGLRYGHVEIVVGVLREGEPGVVTLNSPPGYERGRFGEADYPPVFFAIEPGTGETGGDLEPEAREAIVDSIRTWALLLAAVGQFPLDYHGGDPVAAWSRERLETTLTMAVRASVGDQAAEQFWSRAENRLYCGELAYLAINAGLMYPIDAATLVPLVGEETWRSFVAVVAEHRARALELGMGGGEVPSSRSSGRRSERGPLESIRNPLSRLVEPEILSKPTHPVRTVGPDWWKSSATSAPPAALPIEPMTLVDLLELTLRTEVPRRELGESMAEEQARWIRRVVPRLSRVVEPVVVSAGEPESIEELEAAAESVARRVERRYASYDDFRAALLPALGDLRDRLCHLDGPERCLFVPPSQFHWMAKEVWPARGVRLRYVGHGMHFSFVRRQEGAASSDGR